MANVSEALALAVDHHMAGRLAEAETLYGRILDAVPDQPQTLHLLGVLLAQTGRIETGLSCVEAAIAVEPDVPAFHLNRGKICDALGRYDASLDSYRNALIRRPDLAEAWERADQALRQLAERAFDSADFPRAASYYRRVLALRPGDLVATFDRAMVLKHLRDLDGSATALGHAVRLNPRLERAHRERAEVLSTLGRWLESLDSRRSILASRPDDAEAWWALAVSLHRAGTPPAGAEWRIEDAYRRLLALEPSHAGGWGNLGLALQEAAQGMAAVAVGRRAVRVAAMDEGAAVNLASALHRVERFAEAEAAGRRALTLNPASPEALLNRAVALDERHIVEGAEQTLLRLLRLRPDEAPAFAQLGRLCERAGRTERAEGALWRALALQPADEESWAALGRVRLRRKGAVGALASARRSLCLQPGLPSGLLVEGESLECLGADAEALAVYDRVIALFPGIGTAFTRRALQRLRPVVTAPSPRAASGRGRLAGSSLGRAGRFGNQLLQYGVLRIAAERNGLELEVPDWVGRPLYGLDDPLPGTPLPILHEDELGIAGLLAGDRPALRGGRDVVGFFCGDMTPLAPHRDRFRSLFSLADGVAELADRAEAALRSRGRTLVAIHLRRGDFGNGRFWTAPEAWYLDWLGAVWPCLDRPVLYVATDDPAVIRRFAAYAPLHAGDIADPLPGAEFLIDHRMLSSADLLAVSNSSFSVTAAMLNGQAAAMLRPDRGVGGLRPFDPWAEPVLLD
ncbi:tetratricopeptide (TPR) repeat protein [Azospirillum agricola]|uniref:tetratricopeptide repeat protein n=1 Tax=Azospirillum agricola TaxID=1720247 RepID=UPI001AE945C8|nr:tetratricopeptide repeat protein [Azospirillum agricola]MBP2229182.1 tetratricopeptide (TPR) repeat protein [Azospirillum agricola]